MKVWAIAGAALSLMTAGCGIIDLTPRARSAQQIDVSNYFAQRIEAGRAHLAGGRPTKAIEAFRQASYNPAFAADAYNGMGVGYTELGRHDVARAMFVRAIDVDPTDMRFQRNLAKIDEQIMLAQQSAAARAASAEPSINPFQAQIADAAATPAAASARAPVTVSGAIPTTTSKVRVVFIRTAPPAQAKQPTMTARAPVRASRRAPILVGKAQPQVPVQPVRVHSPGPTRIAVTSSTRSARGPNGPVRIYFDKH